MYPAASLRQLLFVIALLALIEFGTAATSDGNLLMIIKDNLSPVEVFHSWDNSQQNPCSWAYVVCDNDFNVTSLTLDNLSLYGTLSPEIGGLSHLQQLILSNNNILGSIPGEIGNLAQLNTLNLQNNAFSGSIPTTLEHLSHLNTLYLDRNKLTGQLPGWLCRVSNWDLSYNHFNGEVPGVFSSASAEGNENLCGSIVKHQLPLGFKYGAVAGTTLSIISVVLFVACFIAWQRWHLTPSPAFFDVAGEEDIEYGHLKKYTKTELNRATNNFDEKNRLGSGASGKVYKGILTDGTEIAAKILTGKDLSSLKENFKREVSLKCRAMHCNVLCLKGVCTTDKEWILVYPYMPKKCVASCLKEEDPLLDWSTRKRIALGTAHGLEYLHDHGNEKMRIIHRDIKAANVFLDNNYEAKIGDFGYAKLQQSGQTNAVTQLKGTPGYVAPEYLSTGKVSEKVDVFSYGMFLIELVTGQSVYDLLQLQNDEEFSLLEHARKLEEERNLAVIIDKNLGQAYILEEVENMIRLALLCTQTEPDKRPKMGEIVSMLDAGCYGVAAKWHAARHNTLPIIASRYEEFVSIEAEELSNAR